MFWCHLYPDMSHGEITEGDSDVEFAPEPSVYNYIDDHGFVILTHDNEQVLQLMLHALQLDVAIYFEGNEHIHEEDAARVNNWDQLITLTRQVISAYHTGLEFEAKGLPSTLYGVRMRGVINFDKIELKVKKLEVDCREPGRYFDTDWGLSPRMSVDKVPTVTTCNGATWVVARTFKEAEQLQASLREKLNKLEELKRDLFSNDPVLVQILPE